MSGRVAERLLNLVPMVMPSDLRFELVKKVRTAFMQKTRRSVSCDPMQWREKVAPAIAEVIAASQEFRLPGEAVSRVRWLADGDTKAAQSLLAAAEQEEAAVRLAYLEDEFRRIDALIGATHGAETSVSHTIQLPQGEVSIYIRMIPEKKGFWATLREAFR